MSEIEGGGGGSVESGGGSGEVSSSSEVSETSAAETGGESSEATQEATTEEAGESGGFDEDTDTTESPEDSAEEYDESDSEGEPDDSQEVGFSEGDDVENAASQYDGSDYENDDTSSGDEDGVGFDDSDDDISDVTDEDADSDTDSSDSPMEEDNDESFDEPNDYEDESSESDWDDQEDEDIGETEDYSDEESLDDSTENDDNIDDTQDDGEAQTEDTDSTADGDEADGDMDNDGELDGTEADTEADTEDGDDIDGDWDDQEDEDVGEPEDYSDEDSLDDSIDDAQDDGEAQTEDTDPTADGDEADSDMDNDGDPDGTEADTEADTEDGDDIDDAQDDGEAQTEDTDSTADGDEADGDMDNDGELDGTEADTEADTEDGDDIDDVQDDGEAQTEDTDSTADGDETDGDMDNDGEPDGTENDTESDIDDDDYDEDEDPGELEEYSDEDTDNRNEDETTDDSESERDQDEEEQAVEENKEAAERAENEAENADVENADKNVDDAAESENKNPAENGVEQQSESADANSTNEVDTENNASRTDENDNGEAQTDTSDNKEDNSTDTRDQNEEQPDDIENKAETPEGEDAYRTAMNNMAEYMSEHNYGPDDYAEYSQDPEWQKLNADLQQSLGMEVTTDVSTPSPESGKDVSATELPDNCVMVNASDIDMTYAQGMDSDQFWNHHGNTKEDYMRMAERIPDVQQALDSGKSFDEIKQDPELKDTAHAYFDPENMIKVEQQADGSYSFADDGRHRIAAAQEMGYEIPVEVTNMPENANAATTDNADMKPEDTTLPEDVANKSDISDETRENLGAFEQNKWDNLSQFEKEQAVEKLRDSIAEDLQLENKPNIAYYNNEDPGDYGGYAASTNTIYINRFNMGDATETADTIAHESRHCWQHERADNPQTEQDYQFKENFDNYVRPELNFEAYQSQPVEQDARDYAAQVKDLIPQDEATQDYSTESFSVDEKQYGTENSRAPPSEEYQSKTVTELPSDFESKNVADVEIIKKEAPSIRGADDFRSHMSSVYKDGDRTAQEKFEYGKKLYNEIPEGQRTDINVVDNFKAIRTDKESLDKGTEGGYLPVAFHDHHGLDESKPINGIENGQPLPDTLCRRGGETGNNLTEPHEDGSVPTTDEIAVPYAENPEAIHVYKTDAEGYKEAVDIISSVDSSNISEKTQEMNDLIERMNDKYDLNNRPVSEEMMSRYAESYNKFQNSNDTQQCRQDGNCDSKYGVCGTVAPMYVDDNPAKEKLYNGGAAQYNTPCSIETFTRLGVFREAE